MISYISIKGRSSLTICEDSLTASVFDGLKYLPTEIFYTILKNALYQDKLPKISGELLDIIFWDKWSAKDTSNSNFVEPDLLLCFEDFDIILEAKRYDEKQQSSHQMQNEIQAYYNNFDGAKNLYFIQLGGLHTKDDEPDYLFQDKKIKIAKTDWTRLLHEVVKQYNLFEKTPFSQTVAYCRILSDVRKAFEMHNFYEMQWLHDVNHVSVNTYQFNALHFLNTKHGK